MKRYGLALVAALVVAGVVMAATDTDPWISVNEQKDYKRPVRFQREVNFNASVSLAHVDAGSQTVGGFTFTPTGRGTLVYDFPSIPATGAGSGCQDSAAGTATGCAFGDGLLFAIDQTLPGNLNGMVPQPYLTAANTFKVRYCNDSSDGGAVDFPDASFTVTCVR